MVFDQESGDFVTPLVKKKIIQKIREIEIWRLRINQNVYHKSVEIGVWDRSSRVIDQPAVLRLELGSF